MWETLNLGTGENTTKAVVRQKVWEYMEKNDIANFPRPVYHRIPNFKGAQSAGNLFSFEKKTNIRRQT
jgi:5-formyltetrahydrofolate cyclo-ligase